MFQKLWKLLPLSSEPEPEPCKRSCEEGETSSKKKKKKKKKKPDDDSKVVVCLEVPLPKSSTLSDLRKKMSGGEFSFQDDSGVIDEDRQSTINLRTHQVISICDDNVKQNELKPFTRIWSLDDELALLRGKLLYREEKDNKKLYELLHTDFSFLPSKHQFCNKLRKMKGDFTKGKKALKNEEICQLCEQIWGR